MGVLLSLLLAIWKLFDVEQYGNKLMLFDLDIGEKHSHRPNPYDTNYCMYTHTKSCFKN